MRIDAIDDKRDPFHFPEQLGVTRFSAVFSRVENRGNDEIHGAGICRPERRCCRARHLRALRNGGAGGRDRLDSPRRILERRARNKRGRVHFWCKWNGTFADSVARFTSFARGRGWRADFLGTAVTRLGSWAAKCRPVPSRSAARAAVRHRAHCGPTNIRP